MKYAFSEEWTLKAKELIVTLELAHIDAERVSCIKSYGTKTRRLI